MLCDRTSVLFKDIARRDLHIDHGRGDVRVTHQVHERGKTDAGTDHIRGERMPEPVRMGDGGFVAYDGDSGTGNAFRQASCAVRGPVPAVRRTGAMPHSCGPFQSHILVE